MENPNESTILVLTDGMSASGLESYQRCLDLFDGSNPDALGSARERWSAARAQGHELHYWQQTDRGGWEEKAQIF